MGAGSGEKDFELSASVHLISEIRWQADHGEGNEQNLRGVFMATKVRGHRPTFNLEACGMWENIKNHTLALSL